MRYPSGKQQKLFSLPRYDKSEKSFGRTEGGNGKSMENNIRPVKEEILYFPIFKGNNFR